MSVVDDRSKESPILRRMSSFEIEKPIMDNENDSDKKEGSMVDVHASSKDSYESRYLTLKQVSFYNVFDPKFCITLTKNITGPGVLSIPFSILKMGIIPTVFFYGIMGIINVWCSHLLIHVNDYAKKNPSRFPYKRIGNDYAYLIYHILGPIGYYIFLVLYFIAIWGVQVSTLITVVDFIDNLPWFENLLPTPESTHLLLHITCTFLCMILVFLKDTKPLVPVSSLGIFALIISFILVLLYGISQFGLIFNIQMLKPLSWNDLFSSMGVASFSLGYNFSFLSFFKQVRPNLKNKAAKALTPCISIITISLIVLPLIAFLSYSNSPSGIKQDVLLSIPKENIISIIISVMMFLSCLFTYPIYGPPLNEILEESIVNKRTVGLFVSDPARLLIRIAQTVGISIIAYYCPFFGDIIFLDILLLVSLLDPS